MPGRSRHGRRKLRDRRRCRRYNGLRLTLSTHIESILHARADGSYARLLVHLARIDVLLIDDWALSPLTTGQRNDNLEIHEDGDGARSTIFAR